jgi:5S rRNA maturation endonuclease (ribonuclease M5)
MFSRLALATGSSKFRLREAYEQGGKVIFLTDFDNSGMLLRDFIRRAWSSSTTLTLAAKSGP